MSVMHLLRNLLFKPYVTEKTIILSDALCLLHVSKQKLPCFSTTATLHHIVPLLLFVMHTRFLIIGQGLTGTYLAHYLLQAQQEVLVVDEHQPMSASRVAAGIINPITGKYMTQTWLANQLIPFAFEQYRQIETLLGGQYLSERPICWLINNQHYYHDCQRLLKKNNTESHIKTITTEALNLPIRPMFGRVEINGGDVATGNLVADYRNYLKQKNCLIETHFDINDLQLTANGVKWQNITANYIIFCEGYIAQQNPYWQHLPYAPVKGEVLIVRIPDLGVTDRLLKSGVFLVPLYDDVYWVGSNYEHWATNHHRTQSIRQQFEQNLQDLLLVPYQVIDHWAAVRPATLHRRPFVGCHPQHPQVGIFNGMGTKGVTLAPYFAQQFAQHLIYQTPLDAEIDVKRYFK